MYRSSLYETPVSEAEAFVATQRHGYLIATPPGGFPSVSVLPFVKEGDTIELHCVQEDPTFAAVQANPLVTFFVCDYLAFSPHHWVSEEDAGRATLHFRAVQYACRAAVTTEPAEVAAALARLLAVQEPDASYAPIVDGERYGPRLRRLAALRLTVLATEAKFKAGPGTSAEDKRKVIAGLRARDEPGDARAADVIEEALRATSNARTPSP